MARNRKRAKERRARRPQPVASRAREELNAAPNPLEHAAPNAEIAEQAELPPDLTASELEEIELEEEVEEEQADEVAFEPEEEPERPQPGATPGAIAEPRARPGGRLITFLEGSWRELQRVQWPDRRQVVQATGVVLGFVIVAGVFLGVSDWAAKHIVNFILYGHF